MQGGGGGGRTVPSSADDLDQVFPIQRSSLVQRTRKGTGAGPGSGCRPRSWTDGGEDRAGRSQMERGGEGGLYILPPPLRKWGGQLSGIICLI